MKKREWKAQLVSIYCYLSALILLCLVLFELLSKYFDLSKISTIVQFIQYLSAIFGVTYAILIASLVGLLQSVLITAIVTVVFIALYLWLGIKIKMVWAKNLLSVLLTLSLLFGVIFSFLNIRDYGLSLLLLLNLLTILIPSTILYLIHSKK